MLSSGLPPSKVEDETMDGEIPIRAPWVQSKEMQNLAATNAALWSLLKLQHELSQQVDHGYSRKKNQAAAIKLLADRLTARCDRAAEQLEITDDALQALSANMSLYSDSYRKEVEGWLQKYTEERSRQDSALLTFSRDIERLR